MAEELSQAQLTQQQTEERERMDEEWMAIAEERRQLDEDKKEVIEERRLLAERRRLLDDEKRILVEDREIMEAERSMIEDKKTLMREDRQKIVEEREDIDRLRENALSGIDDSVRFLRRTARELAEGGARDSEDRSSYSSPEGRSAKRPRRTPGGPQMPSEPTIPPEASTARPTSPRNGTDPLGLSAAPDEIKNIWRQIEFPQEWTGANSDHLFELFTKRATKKALPGNRPLAILDRSATRDACLITRLRKWTLQLDNGTTHPCSVCKNNGWPCIAVDFTVAGLDKEPYDEDGQAKRWKLSIRNDEDDEE